MPVAAFWRLVPVWTLAVLLARPIEAQVPTRPAVFVREIRIDSLLLAFGVDSARVRGAVMTAVRDAFRLATGVMDTVPALDIVVVVPRSLIGAASDPRGFVRVEVGRNLMEEGKGRRLLWEGNFDLSPSPTWRELARGTLAEVVRAVNTYLRVRNDT